MHRGDLHRILPLIGVWIPEVVVAYVIWNMPIWLAGTILAIIFCIVYGAVAVLLSLAILS